MADRMFHATESLIVSNAPRSRGTPERLLYGNLVIIVYLINNNSNVRSCFRNRWGGDGSPAPDGIVYEGVSETPRKVWDELHNFLQINLYPHERLFTTIKKPQQYLHEFQNYQNAQLHFFLDF